MDMLEFDTEMDRHGMSEKLYKVMWLFKCDILTKNIEYFRIFALCNSISHFSKSNVKYRINMIFVFIIQLWSVYKFHLDIPWPTKLLIFLSFGLVTYFISVFGIIYALFLYTVFTINYESLPIYKERKVKYFI